MARIPLAAALVLAAGCASTETAPAPLPAAFTIEVRFERSDGETVIAPRLTAWAGQRATVQVTRPVSYVQSFELQAGSDGGIIADPVVGTVRGGAFLETTAAPLREGGARLDYRIAVEEPGAKMPERRIPLGPSSFTLQMPEVEKVVVAGAVRIPEGEERVLAVLPWPDGHGEVTVKATVRAAEFPEAAADPEARTAAAASVAAPGWFRLRTVRLAAAMEAGAVIEGEALRALLEGEGAVTVDRDLRWAGSAAAPAGASILVDRPLVTDWDFEAGNFSRVRGPILRNFTEGLLADPDPAGGFQCTRSSLHAETFQTSLGRFPVSIDLPEIRVRRGLLPPGPGERLLVLGPREGGGSEGVLLSFQPD